MSQSKPTDSETTTYAGVYVLSGCQSTAFRQTFPETKATDESIHQKASKLHALANVQSRIRELAKEAARHAEEKFELDVDYVANRLKQIDELDVLDIMKSDMKSFKELSNWPKQWRTSISGVDLMTISNSTEGEMESIVKKIKWPDKLKNLELIGKLVTVQAFNEKSSVTHKEIQDDGSNEW